MTTDLLEGNNHYKISVIVPVYNTEPYLKACIDSILNQDYNNIEIIAVDDGSSDNSLDILKKIAKKDNRLLVFSQKNHGVSSARNLGLSKITGDFICFIDSDDIIEKNYIRSMLENIDNADAVFTNFSFLYQNGSVIPKKARLNCGEYKIEELLDILIDDGTLTGILFGSSCMAMYRSNLIKDNNLQFNESIKKNEDGLFNIEYLLKTNKICVINNSGYYYRKYENKKENINFSLLEFEKVNAVLAQYAGRFQNYDKQLSRRKVSSIFWESCKIPNTTERTLTITKKLKIFCKENLNKTDYLCLNFNSISKSKKILMWLLLHKFYFCFSFLMKYILPLFYNKVKH